MTKFLIALLALDIGVSLSKVYMFTYKFELVNFSFLSFIELYEQKSFNYEIIVFLKPKKMCATS